MTPAGELVTIPNTALTSQAIPLPYGRGRYRVGIAYEDDVDDALAILEDPLPRAHFAEPGGDAVNLGVNYWIDRSERNRPPEIRSRYARTVKARLEDRGITIAPPSKRGLLGRIGLDEP